MAKPWGGAGAWALEAERAEAEELDHAASAPPPNPLLAGQPPQSFPSLKEAAAAKQPKKKKPVAVSLAQFASKGLTPKEMLSLPTGPRQRSDDDPELGRGFRSFGGTSAGPRGAGFSNRRADEGDASWGGGGRRGYGGGFDEEGRRGPPSRGPDFDVPSRADEADNWGVGKKAIGSSGVGSGRVERISSFGGGGSSRADDVDNWANTKKPMPSRQSGFGAGGYGDSRGDSRIDSDRWVRGGGAAVGGTASDNGERRRLVLDPPKKNLASASEPAKTRPSPFGAARPREEVLADKGLDWKKIDIEMDSKRSSRPTSSQSSRPSSAQSSRPGSPGFTSGVVTEVAPKSKPKANPFGDAKPREVVLQEKGMDWRKIDLDLEHRIVSRPETVEEKQLKEEISQLKAQAKESTEMSEEELSRLLEDIRIRENSLEILVSQLDDKAKFGQNVTSNVRPGSGAGRSDTSSSRPPSQSGFPEDPRNVEIIDRPRSRGGTADIWSRPMDDRRGRQRSKERGFFESRNVERTGSKDRW